MNKKLAALLSLMLVAMMVLSMPVFAVEEPTSTEATETTDTTDAETPSEGEETEATDETDETEATDETEDNVVPVDFDLPYTDVAEDAWYYADVKAVSEAGLFRGTSETTFNPTGELKVIEAIVLAIRINIFFDETNPAEPTAAEGTWYDNYVAYAIEHEIITEGQFEDYNAVATRELMAVLFANAVPELTVINEDAAATDLEGNENADIINMLYKAGITQGKGEGAFVPDAAIQRSEVAAIVNRLIDETARIGYVALEAPAESDEATEPADDVDLPADETH